MKLQSLVTKGDPGFPGTACNKITAHLKHVSSKPYLPSVHRSQTAWGSNHTQPQSAHHGLIVESKYKSIFTQRKRKPRHLKHSMQG
jgi:hypothetical protein